MCCYRLGVLKYLYSVCFINSINIIYNNNNLSNNNLVVALILAAELQIFLSKEYSCLFI